MFTTGIQNYYNNNNVTLGQPSLAPSGYGNVNNNRSYRQQIMPHKMMLGTELLQEAESMYFDEPIYQPEASKSSGIYIDLQPPFNFDPSPEADHVPETMHNPHQTDNSQRIQIIDSQTDYYLPPLDSDSLWQIKPPEQWQQSEVIDWLFCWADNKGIDKEEINTMAFTVGGHELCQMTREDFCSMEPNFGSDIYDEFQFHRSNSFQNPQMAEMPMLHPDVADPVDWSREQPNQWVPVMNGDMQRRSPYSNSDQESTSSSMTTVNEKAMNYGYMPQNRMIAKPGLPPMVPPGMKKMATAGVSRRGRPRKTDAKSRNRQGKGTGKLWEFIRDLLLSPNTNPSLIRWERREDGIFKFVQSDKVAKMWGDRKQNPRMTYEKLSRAMRYYYKSQVLLPVFGRRLVYKFGPNATGWRPLHPGVM